MNMVTFRVTNLDRTETLITCTMLRGTTVCRQSRLLLRGKFNPNMEDETPYKINIEQGKQCLQGKFVKLSIPRLGHFTPVTAE